MSTVKISKEMISENYNNLQEELSKFKDILPNYNLISRKISGFFGKDIYNYLSKLSAVEKNDLTFVFFERLTDRLVAKGANLLKNIPNKTIKKKIKNYFRKTVGAWSYNSLIVKRAFEKPRGYPGDYLTLEIIYNNLPITDKMETIGYFFDIYFLKNPLALAVRERKDKMAEYLYDFVEKHNPQRIKILNFASGAIREVRDLLQKFPSMSEINFTFLDFDEEALSFSQSQIKVESNFKFLRQDIFKIIKNSKNIIGNQDLIYSIGLIDYLPERILIEFIKCCYNLVVPGGRIILSHKDCEEHSPLLPDWFCDWNFYPRSKSDISKIILKSGIDLKNLKIESLPCKIIFSIFIDKPQN